MINTVLKINARQLETAIYNSIKKKTSLRVVQRIKDDIRDIVRYNTNKIMREEVAKYAPEYFIEKQMLNLGVDDKSRQVGSTTISSSFMKEPQFMYLKDAIMSYANFNMRSTTSGNLFHLTFELSEASKKKINDVIGFAWMKKLGKNRLERRTTLDAAAYHPTWNQLLDIWEYGGTSPSFTVKSRDGGKLHAGPDKRFSSAFVTKTIKPHRMFYLGMASSKRKILRQVEQTLTKRFKK